MTPCARCIVDAIWHSKRGWWSEICTLYTSAFQVGFDWSAILQWIHSKSTDSSSTILYKCSIVRCKNSSSIHCKGKVDTVKIKPPKVSQIRENCSHCNSLFQFIVWCTLHFIFSKYVFTWGMVARNSILFLKPSSSWYSIWWWSMNCDRSFILCFNSNINDGYSIAFSCNSERCSVFLFY